VSPTEKIVQNEVREQQRSNLKEADTMPEEPTTNKQSIFPSSQIVNIVKEIRETRKGCSVKETFTEERDGGKEREERREGEIEKEKEEK
jgi:hypothetical protein